MAEALTVAIKGRRRKRGARHLSGDIKPAIDRGTPEGRSRRGWDAGDPNLTWPALGVLYAHGEITVQEYEAGCEFRRHYCLASRRPDAPAAPLDGLPAGHGVSPPDYVIAEAEARLAPAKRALCKLGFETWDEWLNLVVFNKRPRWMEPRFRNLGDLAASGRFKAAMRKVVRVQNEPPQKQIDKVATAP